MNILTSRCDCGMSPCSARARIASPKLATSSLQSRLVSQKMMVRPHAP
jgi:hypothetical protein